MIFNNINPPPPYYQHHFHHHQHHHLRAGAANWQEAGRPFRNSIGPPLLCPSPSLCNTSELSRTKLKMKFENIGPPLLFVLLTLRNVNRQYIRTFLNKIRALNKIWANRSSLYFILADGTVEEQLNFDCVFVYFNLQWFCLFKASCVYLLQFSAQGSSGRVPSNFRFLCGRGNWIVCWSSGGRRVSRVKQRSRIISTVEELAR